MLNKFISLMLLIILFPVIAVISLIILIIDGKPFLFTQKRFGKNNSTFTLYKFRTMKKGTKDIPTHLIKKSAIKYIPFGLTLRKFSLDEIPQLINIFNGEMNFIGPRPALHNQDDLNELRDRLHLNILKPGLTGWAQINGRDDLSLEKKVKLDKYYLDNKSIILDIKIIILTVIKVFSHSGVHK